LYEITPGLDSVISDRAVRSSMAKVLFRKLQRVAEKRSGCDGEDALTACIDLNKPLGIAEAERLVYFEKLFFIADNNSNGYLQKEECLKLLSYLDFGTSPQQLEEKFSAFDADGNGFLTQVEFIVMCCSVLWAAPLKMLKVCAENYASAMGNQKERNQIYWRAVAFQVDKLSRIVVPATYVFVMLILFSLDFSDDYETAGSVPFAGLGIAEVSTAGWVQIMIVPVGLLVVLLSWLHKSNIWKATRKMKLVRAVSTLVKTQSRKRQMTKAMAMDLETGSANTDFRKLDLIIDRWAERSQQKQPLTKKPNLADADEPGEGSARQNELYDLLNSFGLSHFIDVFDKHVLDLGVLQSTLHISGRQAAMTDLAATGVAMTEGDRSNIVNALELLNQGADRWMQSNEPNVSVSSSPGPLAPAKAAAADSAIGKATSRGFAAEVTSSSS